MENDHKLKIGVLCDGLTFDGWQAEILKFVLAHPRMQITLLIRNTFTDSYWAKLQRRPANSVLFTMLNRLEGKLTSFLSPVAYTEKSFDLGGVLVDVPTINVQPQVSKSRLIHRVSPDDCAEIRKHECDLILRFGFNILKGEILSCARHGIWSFHHADNSINRGGPMGFWEWYTDAAYSGTVLQILTEDLDAGTVINRARYTTYRYSWGENRRRMFDRSVALMLDSLERLARAGQPEPLRSNPFYDKALYKAPPLRITALAPFMEVARILARAAERLFFRYQWGFQIGDVAGSNIEFRNFGPAIFPRRGLFWADPFLIRRDNKDYVYVEEYSYKLKRARICCLEFEKGQLRSVTPVLEKPFHLSYPYLFEFEDALYMVPEMHEANRIEVYRCTEFPARWEAAGTLMESVRAVDTSIHYLNNKWWMFTNISRNNLIDPGYELHLFSSDDPVGRDWTSHPRNPVIQDAEFARNGGGVINLGGTIYRFAQGNDTRTYGSNLVVRKIVKLDDVDYQEETVQKIFPDWHKQLKGAHHFSVHGDRGVVDGHRLVSRFLPW